MIEKRRPIRMETGKIRIQPGTEKMFPQILITG